MKKRIAVIFGGESSEHEVSCFSAQSVLENIDRDKYDVTMIGITKLGKWLLYDGDIENIGTGLWEQEAQRKLLETNSNKLKANNNNNVLIDIINFKENKSFDVVFPVLHGCNGEDGTIQGLFELAGVPYVGCGVLASSVGMDKAFTKIVFEKAGIPQCNYVIIKRKELEDRIDKVVTRIEERIGYPCFIKPSNAGSSVGVNKAKERDSLIDALNHAAKYDRKIVVEEFIDGREIECAVLGNDDPEASTVGEIVACNEFYDYKAKYIDGDSKIIIPAKLPQKTIDEIREYAKRAFLAIDGAGLSRVDFFVENETGRIIINEINTLPGFTSISMYSKLWNESGIPYKELISKLIEYAEENINNNKREIDR